LQQIQGERKEARVETENPYRKIIFHPVPAGSFQRRIEGKDETTTLTHPFEAMETKVTQWQWAQVMGDNPSHFVNGPQSIEIEINGKKVRLNPDNPVENITWWSALVFANRLSALNGFKHAYDLSRIAFVDGSADLNRPILAADEILRVAAKGSLKALYSDLRINAPEENIYETEGYRLPTSEEQLHLMSAAGTLEEMLSFGDDGNQLKNHAWYKDNSAGKTHPVGLLRPMFIGTGVFYDVLGNVFERVYNRIAVSGGCYWSPHQAQFGPDASNELGRDTRDDCAGLRLVRTLKPGAQVIERVRTQ
jgi:formylglycine-generating enzyme required for sulfatase activity